jgi:A/G-specific adenine glycosylase
VGAFPTLADLAAASEHEVLRLWEGLGYYRRARQLHRAAQVCRQVHGGEVPRDEAALCALPGVGRYTAAAVRSIAYDAPAAILEANTLRVYCRLLGYRGDPYGSAGQQFLWRAAEALVPRRGAGRLNQALMELGATVCVPAAPKCPECPARRLCLARQAGIERTVPPPKREPASVQTLEAAVVVARGRRVLLLQQGEQGRWAGLWDFPRFTLTAEGDAAQRREVAAKTAERTGVAVGGLRQIATLRHTVTRFRITLACFSAETAAPRRPVANGLVLRWVDAADLEHYPMSVTARKLAELVAAGLHRDRPSTPPRTARAGGRRAVRTNSKFHART